MDKIITNYLNKTFKLNVVTYVTMEVLDIINSNTYCIITVAEQCSNLFDVDIDEVTVIIKKWCKVEKTKVELDISNSLIEIKNKTGLDLDMDLIKWYSELDEDNALIINDLIN